MLAARRDGARPRRGRGHRFAGLLVGVLGALFCVHAARAAAVASLFEWDAPEGCAGALEVHARLSQLLGREPETLGTLSRVRGSVLRTATGYRLVLEAFERERRSSRLFDAPRCDDLADAAAIAIALAIAPEGHLPGSVPPEDEPASADAHEGHAATAQGAPDGEADAALVDVGSAAVGAASEAPLLRGFAAADVLVEYGALPRPTPGFAVAGGVDVAGASLGAYAALLAAQTLSVAPRQEVEFDLLTAGLRGCYSLRAAAPRLSACAIAEAGRFRALGLDLAPARQARDLWLAAGAALDVQWPVSRALGVQLRAEPLLPLLRKRYTINGSEEVHAPAVISTRIYLGLTFSGG